MFFFQNAWPKIQILKGLLVRLCFTHSPNIHTTWGARGENEQGFWGDKHVVPSQTYKHFLSWKVMCTKCRVQLHLIATFFFHHQNCCSSSDGTGLFFLSSLACTQKMISFYLNGFIHIHIMAWCYHIIFVSFKCQKPWNGWMRYSVIV